MTLYNCHTDGDQYRITKFDSDGNVESTYLCTEDECECPAGVRPTCRHRQMLPKFIARNAVNTFWFFDFDHGGWVTNEPELSIELKTQAETKHDHDEEQLAFYKSSLEPRSGLLGDAEPELEAESDLLKWDKIISTMGSGNDPVAPDKGWLEPALNKAAERAAQMPKWMVDPVDGGSNPPVVGKAPWRRV